MRNHCKPYFLFLCILAAAIPCTSLADQKPPITLPHHSPDTPQGAEGGFWKLDNNYDPILRLKNVLINRAVDVTPKLYFADGTEFTLPVVHLEAAGIGQVDIRLALQSVPASLSSHVSSYGMVGISYQWSWPAVIASLQNTDEIASLTLTNSLIADTHVVHAAPETDNLQAIHGSWWLPTAASEAFLALENTSISSKQIGVQLTDRSGKVIAQRTTPLAPHATTVLSLSSILGNARSAETLGGIEIEYSGPDHGVVAYSGIEDGVVGYSASPLQIEDRRDLAQPAHAVTVSAAGLMLGKADSAMLFPSGTAFTPYAYLRNVSADPLTVSPSLTYNDATGLSRTIALGNLSLAPGQTSQFDFSPYFNAKSPLPDGFGHLSFAFQGREGDLILEAGSVDQSQSYVFSVTTSLLKESASRTLCFWSVEGDNDTMTTIWNYKTVAQDLILTLYYSGGQYRLPIHLDPQQAYNLDMMTLIHSQKPGMDGNLIPSNITTGSAILSGPGAETDKISVAVSSAIYNVRNATCGPPCTTCNGATEFQMNPSSYTMPVGGSSQASAQVTWNTGSTYTNPTGTAWSTASSTVATVSSTGMIAGKGAGQTGTTAQLSNYPVYTQDCLGYMQGGCPDAPINTGGPTNVTPIITVGPIFSLTLNNYYPKYVTGVGIVVGMQVGPASYNFDGYQFPEIVSQVSTTCPSNFPMQCLGNSVLLVGAQGMDQLGNPYESVHNQFWDQHFSLAPVSYTTEDDIESCSIVCSQTYTWNGVPVGTFLITRSFKAGVIGPFYVTNVDVTKVGK